jgi:hypothetical protein
MMMRWGGVAVAVAVVAVVVVAAPHMALPMFVHGRFRCTTSTSPGLTGRRNTRRRSIFATAASFPIIERHRT